MSGVLSARAHSLSPSLKWYNLLLSELMCAFFFLQNLHLQLTHVYELFSKSTLGALIPELVLTLHIHPILRDILCSTIGFSLKSFNVFENTKWCTKKHTTANNVNNTVPQHPARNRNFQFQFPMCCLGGVQKLIITFLTASII